MESARHGSQLVKHALTSLSERKKEEEEEKKTSGELAAGKEGKKAKGEEGDN